MNSISTTIIVALGALVGLGHTNAANREMACSGFLTDMRTIGVQLGECDLNSLSERDFKRVTDVCGSPGGIDSSALRCRIRGVGSAHQPNSYGTGFIKKETRVLSVSPSGSPARTAHEDLIGSWCPSPYQEDDKDERHYWPKDSDCGDGILTIHRSSYEGWEQSCRFTSVKTRFDPSVDANTKMMGTKVSRINANCSGEECTWKEQMTAYVTKGTLVVKNRRHYRERCTGG